LRPFRFGFQSGSAESLEAWQARARTAEADGYSTFMVPDHLGRLSTFPAIMAAAAATEHINLASYVLNQDFRPPGVLALEAATVHLLTQGRLELGLGAGWARREYLQAGLPFDPGPERVRRFGEYARIVKDLLAAEQPYSFGGEFYTLQDYLPVPKHPSGPPELLIGGGSPHMLSIAGQLADIISISTRATHDGRVDMRNLTLAAVEAKLDRIRSAAGARFADIELNMTVREIRLTTDRAQAARQILAEWTSVPRRYANAESLTEQDLLASPHLALGTEDEIVSQWQTSRERWGINYLQIGERDAAAIAPVVQRLVRQPASHAR
jgi:probable F420-dependent oxidoreductase